MAELLLCFRYKLAILSCKTSRFCAKVFYCIKHMSVVVTDHRKNQNGVLKIVELKIILVLCSIVTKLLRSKLSIS